MRKAALLIHRYLGLAAGVVVAVLGVTGSALVYGDEIDRALNPELLSVRPSGEPIGPGAALAAVRGAGVEVRPDLVEMPRGPTAPYVVHGPAAGAGGGEGRRAVYVDPYRADLLGSRPEHGGLVGTLFRLHADLLAGPAGRQAVGWIGLVLLVLCVTGAVLWWPRVARLQLVRDALGVRWGESGRRTNYDLHRAGGAWTLPYLALLAVTGSGLVFYGVAGDLVNAATGSEPMPAPPASAIPADTSRGPVDRRPDALDRAWRQARASLPAARFSYVYLPGRPEGALGFRGRTPAELHPNGRSFVWFDRWTGERLRVDEAARADPGPRLLHAAYPVHVGAFDVGPVDARWIRAVWALLGLAPAVLLVTGVLVWWWRGTPSSGAG
jgi:uncharacterized iron-regulated membrane protein